MVSIDVDLISKQLDDPQMRDVDLVNLKDSDLSVLVREIIKKGSEVANKPLAKEILSKGSVTTITKNDIRTCFESNSHEFICLLQNLDDNMGFILFNVVTSKDADAIEQIFVVLKANLRKLEPESIRTNQDYSQLRFNLSLLLSLISNTRPSRTDYLSIIFSFLGAEFNQEETISLITLIIVKELEINKSSTENEIKSYLEILLENGSSISIPDLTSMLKLTEIIFPLSPIVSISIFMSNDFKDTLLELQEHGRLNAKSAVNVLNCFSSACINDECRIYIGETYIDFLSMGMVYAKSENVKLFSALVLVKIWDFIKSKNNVNNLPFSIMDLCYLLTSHLSVESVDERVISYSTKAIIEGIAYLSLKHEVQKILRLDEQFIEKLLTFLNTLNKNVSGTSDKVKESSLIYGISIILSQITKIKEVSSQKDKTLEFLKSYADPKQSAAKIQETNEETNLFNESLLEVNEIVGKIASNFKHYTRPIQNQFVMMLYSFSSNRSLRNQVIQQGGLNLVLDYLVQWSDLNKKGVSNRSKNDTDEDTIFGLNSLRCLARLLISSNPNLVFKKYSALTSIPFLIELLGPDLSDYGEKNSTVPSYQYDISNLDIYESLLALTNLSSLEDIGIKNSITNKSFQFLDNFLIDSNENIQTAALELISNLIFSPVCSEKFFNAEVPENSKRLDLLISLIDLKDENSQRAVLGIFANASEFEMIARLLLDKTNLINRLIAIYEEQFDDYEIIIRANYLLLNMVSSIYNDEDKLKEIRSNSKLKEAMVKVIKNNKNKEMVSGIWEICKVVKYI